MVEEYSQLDFETSQAFPPPPPPLSKWDKLQEKVKQADQVLNDFVERQGTVRIANMEINLTAIWDFLTAPLRWIFSLFG